MQQESVETEEMVRAPEEVVIPERAIPQDASFREYEQKRKRNPDVILQHINSLIVYRSHEINFLRMQREDFCNADMKKYIDWKATLKWRREELKYTLLEEGVYCSFNKETGNLELLSYDAERGERAWAIERRPHLAFRAEQFRYGRRPRLRKRF